MHVRVSYVVLCMVSSNFFVFIGTCSFVVRSFFVSVCVSNDDDVDDVGFDWIKRKRNEWMRYNTYGTSLHCQQEINHSFFKYYPSHIKRQSIHLFIFFF